MGHSSSSRVSLIAQSVWCFPGNLPVDEWIVLRGAIDSFDSHAVTDIAYRLLQDLLTTITFAVKLDLIFVKVFPLKL